MAADKNITEWMARARASRALGGKFLAGLHWKRHGAASCSFRMISFSEKPGTVPTVPGFPPVSPRGWYKTASSNPVVRKALVCSGSGCELFFIRNQGTLCCRFDDVSDRLWLRHIYCVAAFHFNDPCSGALRHLPLGIWWNHPVFGRQ